MLYKQKWPMKFMTIECLDSFIFLVCEINKFAGRYPFFCKSVKNVPLQLVANTVEIQTGLHKHPLDSMS